MNIKFDSNCDPRATQCDLVRPGRIGIMVRVVVSSVMVSLAALGVRVGGAWLILAFGAGTLGILIALAGMLGQAGCEVNLIWHRLLGRAPIDCFLFGPIDRWEQKRCK
jgi:hypothetical protein